MKNKSILNQSFLFIILFLFIFIELSLFRLYHHYYHYLYRLIEWSKEKFFKMIQSENLKERLKQIGDLLKTAICDRKLNSSLNIGQFLVHSTAKPLANDKRYNLNHAQVTQHHWLHPMELCCIRLQLVLKTKTWFQCFFIWILRVVSIVDESVERGLSGGEIKRIRRLRVVESFKDKNYFINWKVI